MINLPVKVEGLNESFCDILFVDRIVMEKSNFAYSIENSPIIGSRWRDFVHNHLRLKEIMHSQTQRNKKLYKDLILISLNVDHLSDVIWKNKIRFSDSEYKELFEIIPSRFIKRREIPIASKLTTDKMREDLRRKNRDLDEDDYMEFRETIEYGNIKIKLVIIREQAISYLKQKYPEKRKHIELLVKLSQTHDDSLGFDEYINKWADRLLTEKVEVRDDKVSAIDTF